MSDGAALALLIHGLTAWHLYRTSARIQEGETVDVHAAAADVTREDLADALIEANGGERVDVVLEMAGGRVFDAWLRALAPSAGSSPTAWRRASPTRSPAAR